MSQARLPDGSRIVDARRASPDAVLRGFVSLDGAINELRAYKTNDGVMSELRSLDGGSLGRSDADELLRRIASALLNKSLLWELPAGSFASALRAVPSTASDSPKPATSRGGTTVRASLFTGGTTFRKAEPPKKPKVTPKLALEYAVVLLRSPDATRVECAFEQDPAAPAYDKGLRLSIKGAGDVEAYADEALITKLDLSAAVPGKVYLKGVKAGLFELTLDVEEDPRFERGEPAKAAMAVVELNLGLHKQDVGAIGRLQANPDQDPVSKYHDDLKALKLPEQIEVTEAEKADGTRWLHAQRGGSHARAKLLLRKLDAALWPAGCDDYRITLEAKEPKVAFYDVEWDGAPLPRPHAFKVSALKAADKTLWVEGLEASAALGDVRLSLGLDRSPGGVDKKPKREGDVARLTVVEITEVKLEFSTDSGTPEFWDGKRFFINTDQGAERDGRTLSDKPALGRHAKVTARVTPNLPGIPLRFMLAAPAANADPAKWTQRFSWGKLDLKLKAADRPSRTHYLPPASATDAAGVAEAKGLVLSRLGGDRLQVGVFLDQDPHLARFIPDVADLSRRKPTLSPEIEVWRRIWAQITRNASTTLPPRNAAVSEFGRLFMDYVEVDETTYTSSQVRHLTWHEEWQFTPDAGTRMILCVGDHNKRSFHSFFKPASPYPTPKSHLIVCDAQWDPKDSEAMSWTAPTPNTRFICVDREKRALAVVLPALDGFPVVLGGTWEWDDSQLTHKGPLDDSMLSISTGRKSPAEFELQLPSVCPSSCACGGGSSLAISPLMPARLVRVKLNAAKGPWGGESGNPHCLITGTSNGAHLNQKVLHEIGHQLGQVRLLKNWLGVPDHPNPYYERGGQGDHCKFRAQEDPSRRDRWNQTFVKNGSCVMFHAVLGNTSFCSDCSTDLRVRDCSDFGVDT